MAVLADVGVVVPDGPATGWSRTGSGAAERMRLLYTLHADALFRYLHRLTMGDRRETEDALQETLLRSWRYLQQRPLVVETLRPWLYTVARRVVIDSVRARKARPTDDPAADITTLATPDDDVERMLTVLAIRRGLQALTPEHREVLVELFYNERSVKEVAEKLGIPLGTVKSRTYYALRALRAATAVHA